MALWELQLKFKEDYIPSASMNWFHRNYWIWVRRPCFGTYHRSTNFAYARTHSPIPTTQTQVCLGSGLKTHYEDLEVDGVHWFPSRSDSITSQEEASELVRTLWRIRISLFPLVESNPSVEPVSNHFTFSVRSVLAFINTVIFLSTSAKTLFDILDKILIQFLCF